MGILNVVALLGGLALFLYGIQLMGDGLDMVAGNKVQLILARLTSNPVKGIFLGAGVTALIQSSTATSVMAIGFVNSGLMEFYNAISIVLGAIVGTSITGWIVSLSSLGHSTGWMSLLSTTFITGLFATIGILLVKFSKSKTVNSVGTVLLGFAVLMYGMIAMSDSVSPLRESPVFMSMLTKVSNPLIGILVGMLFTAVIQSSSAAVGILQALSMTGAISFSVAYPLVLGIAIGAAVPVLISALGASLNAKRTAFVHLFADVAGVVICGTLFYVFNSIFHFSVMTLIMTPVTIALLNTVFRVASVAFLAPAIRLVEKIICFILKDTPVQVEANDWDLLEDRFIQHPTLALDQCRTVLTSMGRKVRTGVNDALTLLRNYSDDLYQKVKDNENNVDQYEDRIGNYLLKITSSELTAKENGDVHKYLHAITDLERISDYSAKIADSIKEMREEQIGFSEGGLRELEVIERTVTDMLDMTLMALKEDDPHIAKRVRPFRERIDTLSSEMKARHVLRLRQGICSRQSGFVFTELITSFERIAGHCTSIAMVVIEIDQNAFDKHGYVDAEMQEKDDEYRAILKTYNRRYKLPELQQKEDQVDSAEESVMPRPEES